MKNKNIKLIFICFFFSTQISVSQQLSNYQIDELSNVISNEQLESGAPGAVFAIVQNDSIIFQKALGVTNIETLQPMTMETVFPIASVTKFITSLALLNAMEDKKIEVNTTVGTILNGLSQKLSSLTIHHLLSHSAGLIDWWPNTNDCKTDIYQYFLKAGDKVIFENQGAVFSYSNNGYTLAGLLLSKLESMSYANAIKKMIIKPLQMNSTTFKLEEAVTHSFATGHSKDNSGKIFPTPTGITSPTLQPAGGLFSNVTDLAKLATCFINNGSYNDDKIFSPEVIKKMSIGYTDVGVLKQFLVCPDSKYSYGTFVFKRKGIYYVANEGEAGNANALLVIAPIKKTAFIALSNTGFHPFVHSVEKAMDLMFPESEAEAQDLPKENFEELVGKYYEPNIEGTKDNIVEIINNNDELLISFSQNEPITLIHSGIGTYTYIDPTLTIPLEITFFRDNLGKVNYLNIFWRTFLKIE